MFLIYYGYYEIWSIFIPCLMAFGFISYLMGIKVYLEEYLPRKAAARVSLGTKLGSALLPDAHANGDQGGGDSGVH